MGCDRSAGCALYCGPSRLCALHRWCAGGMPGAKNIAENSSAVSILQRQHSQQKLVAAICAAPVVVLLAIGIITPNTAATAHPGFSDQLPFADKVSQFHCLRWSWASVAR
jgi:putative intracellular protease/amidase